MKRRYGSRGGGAGERAQAAGQLTPAADQPAPPASQARPAATLSGPARGSRGARPLGWGAAAAIAVSVLLMAAVAGAGPSAVVPALPGTWPSPPWWLAVRPPREAALALAVAAILTGAAGVAAGLAAVRRGAHPPGRWLLAAGLTAAAALTVLPPAGSSDSLSYAAYGRIAASGHSPYELTPAHLAGPFGAVAAQWRHSPSVYGPVATATEWAAAELGGSSPGRVVWWLKVWLALAFGAVALALDRLLRDDPGARARAHLLWSVNPLMLWAVLAGAHVDGLAAGLGFLGLVALRPRAGAQPDATPGPAGQATQAWRGLTAGLLTGAAAAVKAPFALFGLGAAVAARRSPATLAAVLAGVAAVVGGGYLLAGPSAVRDLAASGGRVALDSLWHVFYGFGTPPSWVAWAAPMVCLGLAALLAWRLPPGRADVPAIRPALVVTLAWVLAWPLQHAWYDAMVFCLLAAYPATRLDWLMLARAVPATLDLLTAGTPAGLARRHHALAAVTAPRHPAAPGGWSWAHLTGLEGRLLVPELRLAAVAAVVVLCVTRAWLGRSGHPVMMGTCPARPAGTDTANWPS